jgi:hypothetical protein
MKFNKKFDLFIMKALWNLPNFKISVLNFLQHLSNEFVGIPIDNWRADFFLQFILIFLTTLSDN